MLLNKIQFKNYRCFLDGEIEFQSDKPINLILGINGSGKTELLYAIWYVLHGFDFHSLKAKENDPYSLNSQLYQRLQSDPKIYNESSEVTLTFEHKHKDKKRTYVLTRREDYEKNKKNSVNEQITLYTYNEHGEKSPLNSGQQKIAEIIEQIIPFKVLSGIMFDGERMMNLSSEDEKSIKAIEGTIEDVTNLKLFTSLINDLDSLDRMYQTEIRKIGRKTSQEELEEISDTILKFKVEQTEKRGEQQRLKIELPKLEKRILNLSEDLKGFVESKMLENERIFNRNQLEKLENDLEKIKNSLQDKEFKNISPILAKGLLEEVDKLIESNPLPQGLTSNAVASILENPDCICGRPHDESTRRTMKELVRKLPPENLNALINEWSVDLKGLAKSKNSEIDEIFDNMTAKQSEIAELKQEINKLSTKISNIDNADLVAKEHEKENLERQYRKEKDNLQNVEKELSYIISEITAWTKRQEELTKADSKTRLIQEKLSFLKKAELMVDKIKEINMNRALKEINEFMSTAYADISEDYPRGRRVYITQYIKDKYKLVAYYENDLKVARTSVELGNLRKKYKELDLDNPHHLNEAYIMDIATNNSTGQSKIMTMSFVKAILDFSSQNRNDEFSVKRQYPLVLDAPFSEISGDNLIKSAKNLYKFNEQIILLSDPNTYEGLQEHMNKNIGKVYYFDKNDGESSTTIRKE